jgi:hypothetical protein
MKTASTGAEYALFRQPGMPLPSYIKLVKG